VTGTRAVVAVDIGNSKTKIARVQGESVDELMEFDTSAWTEGRVRLPALPDGRRRICSVVAAATATAATELGAEVIGEDLPLPAKLDYETPDSLGPDRVVAAWAAWTRHPAGAVVVDMGTALTVDWIDEGGVFRGGAIAPGPVAMASGLRGAAPALTAAEPDLEARWPGKNTTDSLRVGVTAAVRGVVTDLVRQARVVAGAEARIVVTGGGGALVSRLLEDDHEVDPHLLLRGIAAAPGS